MNLLRSLLQPRYRPFWRALLAVLVLVVSWFAFKPASGTEEFNQLDKLQHAFAFAILAVVASLAWPAGSRHTWRIALALLAYGLLIELVQSRLPTRTASAADWMADAVGLALGLLVMRALRRFR